MGTEPKYPNVTVKLILRCKDEVFMLRYHSNGRHDFPGGQMEWGEAPLETLQRELIEELNYTLPAEPQFIDIWNYISEDQSRHSVQLFYLLSVVEKPDFHTTEDAELEWLPKEYFVKKDERLTGKIFGSTPLPQIRIKDAWLLRDATAEALYAARKSDLPMPSGEEVADVVRGYAAVWQPFENRILQGMCDILGLSFQQNIIDVYIAPWFYPFSDPLVVGIRQEPDKFIDTLTHELLHRLLTDNTAVLDKTRLRDEWAKMFGQEHSFVTTVHIPVHAVHKAIYLDVLQAPERMERDITSCQTRNATDYVKSWEYVNSRDYKELIGKLKTMYASLAKNHG